MSSFNLLLTREAHANKGRVRRFRRRIQNFAWLFSSPMNEAHVAYIFLSTRSLNKARKHWRASR